MPTPQDTQPDFANARDLLRPELAERLSKQENPHWSQDELVCSWPLVNESQHQICARYIGTYCDVSNDRTARRWVQDPKIKDQTYPGKWRLVDCVYDRNRRGNPGIIRRLRKGFATALSWDEAFILNKHDLQENERYIVAVIPNFDPAYIEDALSSLRTAGTITDPKLEGKTYTGDWEIIHMRPEKVPEDGCMEIRLFLAQPQFTFTTFDALDTPNETDIIYLWNVPKRTAQALVDTYKTGTGASAIANYSTEQGLVDITVRRKTDTAQITISNIQTEDGCFIEEFSDFYWGMTKAQAEAFTVGVAPQGWIYDSPIFRYSGDGFYDAIVRKRHQLTLTLYEGLVVENIKEHTVARSEYSGQTSKPGDLSQTDGLRRSYGNLRKNQYCQWDYELNEETVAKLSGTEREISPGHTENVTLGVHDATQSLPTVVNGQIQHTINRPDPYGKFSTEIVVRQHNDLTGADTTFYHNAPTYTYTGKNIVGATNRPALPAAYGVLNVERHDDGLYYGVFYDATYVDHASWDDTNWENFILQNILEQKLEYRTIGGVPKQRGLRISFDVVQTRSALNAWRYYKYRQFTVPDPDVPFEQLPKPGSRVEVVPRHGYRVIRVNSIVFLDWVPDVNGWTWTTQGNGLS